MALTDTIDRATAHRDRFVRMVEPATRELGLDALELEELILALDDRVEVLADANRRARLLRGRVALERQLSRILADDS